MVEDLTRRESIGVGLLASLPRLGGEGGGSAHPSHSVAFATTLRAARLSRFGPEVGLIVLGGFSKPGDAGTGRMMVRDLAVNLREAAAKPNAAFVDQAGGGFRLTSPPNGNPLHDESVIKWLIARSERFGLNPFGDNQKDDLSNGQNLQSAFDAVVRETEASATVRLPSGNWLIGIAPLILNGLRASIVGEGISISYLHATSGENQTALTLKNYGGDTSGFALDSGLPGWMPERARNSRRNGILFDWSGGHGSVRSIEARWFNGFGMKFVNVWDSLIENIITVGCGNNESYAIAFVAAGDTTNHTTITRLQAEDSYGRAILFDETCLNMCVDNIHCEGTIGRRGQYALSLLGSSMSFRNARVANDGGNVDVLLGGAGNVYDRFSFETGVIVDYATGEIGRGKRSFITHSTFDILRILSRNRGEIVITDCTIDQLEIADQARSTKFVRCIIGNVILRGNQTDVTFDDCDINGRWSVEGNPSVHARSCRMENGPGSSEVHMEACLIKGTYRSSFNQQIHSLDCTFVKDVILDGDGARIWLSGRFSVGGSLEYGAGSAYGACALEGRIAGSAHPNWYGTGGTWPRSTVRANPNAAQGLSPYTHFDGQKWSAAPPLI